MINSGFSLSLSLIKGAYQNNGFTQFFAHIVTIQFCLSWLRVSEGSLPKTAKNNKILRHFVPQNDSD